MPKIEEGKVRLTTRVPNHLRETLEQAAELQGATLNQFVVQTAFEQAQRILERETVIRLSREGAKKVFALMDTPPKGNKHLRDAIKKFKESVRVPS